MTRKEAIEVLKDLWRYEHSEFSGKDIRKALDIAINSLEIDERYELEYEQSEQKTDILDKIIAEIYEKISHYEHFSSSNTANGLIIAKKIIDKYRAESEDKHV